MYGDHTEIFLQNCGYVIRDIPMDSPNWDWVGFEKLPPG